MFVLLFDAAEPELPAGTSAEAKGFVFLISLAAPLRQEARQFQNKTPGTASGSEVAFLPETRQTTGGRRSAPLLRTLLLEFGTVRAEPPLSPVASAC